MGDRFASIESRVDELERAVQALEHRLAVVEGVAPLLVGLEPDSTPTAVRLESGFSTTPDVVSVLSLAGRTLMVLGGAYLLRALTDSGVWPASVGVTAGFLYAIVWLGAADRTASHGRGLSATFHGAVATLIVFPLVWEAVTRFRLIGPQTAGLLLTAVTLAMLLVSVRRRLHALAWIAVTAFVATSLACVAATGSIVTFAIADIALGVATLWIGYTQDWVLLRWPVALVADLTVLALAVGVSARTVQTAPAVIITTQLLLLAGYLSSIVVRTLVRGRDVVPFEIVQGVASLVIGFGGAVYVAQTTMFGQRMLAIVSVLGGVACYAVAFTFVARRQGLRQNFYFYTSFALVLVLAGTGMLLADRSVLWAALAVLAAAAARRVGRVALHLHAAVYATAAAVASGLVGLATAALVGSTIPASLFPWSAIVVLVALGACWSMPAGAATATHGVSARLPRAAIAILFTWSAIAWIVSVTIVVISRTAGVPDAGLVATLRTVGIAAGALALARAGRLDRLREAAWLVYPMLALGGLKLLAEDFPRSRPATLFVALAIYGGALIAAPRIARRIQAR